MGIRCQLSVTYQIKMPLPFPLAQFKICKFNTVEKGWAGRAEGGGALRPPSLHLKVVESESFNLKVKEKTETPPVLHLKVKLKVLT